MKTSIRDNLARFFYDTAKLSMGVLVLGVITKRPFPVVDLILGIGLTLIFLGAGVKIELDSEREV